MVCRVSKYPSTNWNFTVANPHIQHPSLENPLTQQTEGISCGFCVLGASSGRSSHHENFSVLPVEPGLTFLESNPCLPSCRRARHDPTRILIAECSCRSSPRCFVLWHSRLTEAKKLLWHQSDAQHWFPLLLPSNPTRQHGPSVGQLCCKKEKKLKGSRDGKNCGWLSSADKLPKQIVSAKQKRTVACFWRLSFCTFSPQFQALSNECSITVAWALHASYNSVRTGSRHSPPQLPPKHDDLPDMGNYGLETTK